MRLINYLRGEFINRFYITFFILATFLYSRIIFIPEEYSTIQKGIDAAEDTDTVLVYPGTYYENIHISKSITLASYALFDDLSDWYNYHTNIINEHIAKTIIDGSTATDDYGSCILIYSSGDDCITPTVLGFTIQNGIGTNVIRNPGTGNEEVQRIGGGLLFQLSNPTIAYNQFLDNGTILAAIRQEDDAHPTNNITDINSGGALYGGSSDEDWVFEPSIMNGRSRCNIEEFNLTNNLFKGNAAIEGNTFSNRYFENTVNMSGSIFDVASCPEDQSEAIQVSSTWVDIGSDAALNLALGEGNLCAIMDQPVYVDSNIEEECVGQDCGISQENPFKTIQKALEMIIATEDRAIDIHIANGEYSPISGEQFPIILDSYINLLGEDRDLTILDNDNGFSRIINIVESEGNTLSNLTFKNGSQIPDDGLDCDLSEQFDIEEKMYIEGGAMYIRASSPILSDIYFYDNQSCDGGAVFASYSNPEFRNIVFDQNSGKFGGAIYGIQSKITLSNVEISNNYADVGGGVFIWHSDGVLFENVTIRDNIAEDHAGGIFSADNTNFTMFKTRVTDNIANIVVNGDLCDSPGGLTLWHTQGAFNFVNIENNTGGMFILPNDGSGITDISINNSIIWDNGCYNIADGPFVENQIQSFNITYSDIGIGLFEQTVDALLDGELLNENGTWGDINDYNYNLNPEYIDYEDYNISDNSPCIDKGDENPFYCDLEDGSRADLGHTGGSNIHPNFTEYDFGMVGQVETAINFILKNFRETAITIESVSFLTENFYSSTMFPLTIEPGSEGDISIHCLTVEEGNIIDRMEIIGNITDGQNAYIDLTATGALGNFLSGNLSGTLSRDTYIIVDDIYVTNQDQLTLQGGTKFLFDGPYHFDIKGVLIAQGEVGDSIIFDNYMNDQDSIVHRGYRDIITNTKMKKFRTKRFKLNSNLYPISNHGRFDCQEGYVEDCSGDGDCCSETWIGDGYGDCEDQAYGCDLTCYDNDNGDCDVAAGCDDGEFDCLGDGTECIPGSYVCDGSDEFCNAGWGPDCSNGADEGLEECGYEDECEGEYDMYWRGITLDGTTDETILEYVRVSGAIRSDAGGIKLNNDHSQLSHMTISHNFAYDQGGGLGFYGSNSNLSNVTISNNTVLSSDNSWSSQRGGGVYIREANPTFTNVIIKNNSVEHQDGYGGGMSMQSANATFNNIIIEGNQSAHAAGVVIWSSLSTFKNIIIRDNIASGIGGGLVMADSSPIFERLSIVNNHADVEANAMHIAFESNPIFINSIIANNSGSWSNIIIGINDFINNAIFINTIICVDCIEQVDNPYFEEVIYLHTNHPPITIKYSNIEGGWGSDEDYNINNPPLFSDIDNADYTLSNQSPCIDKGTADLSQFDLPDAVPDEISDDLFCGNSPDIGAYEYCVEILMGDINYDQIVDIHDIIIITSNIGISKRDSNYLLQKNDSTHMLDIRDIIIIIDIILNK